MKGRGRASRPPASAPASRRPPSLEKTRVPSGFGEEVPLIGALSKPETAAQLARLAKLRRKLLREAADAPQRPSSPPRRIGEISKAIIETLTKARGPMHVSDIHRSVERLLERPVNPRSVKGRLSEGTLLRKPRFQRTAYGYYQLS